MKKLLAGFVFAVLLNLFPGRVFAEAIREFQTDAAIEKDGTVGITETIRYDFGSASRHGIFRKIPLIKTNADGKKFQLEYGGFSVTDESGNRYRVSRSEEDGYVILKVGDPDRTITGLHTYIISYTVSGSLTYFSDHVEFYWNATGNEWEAPIQRAGAAVSLPGGAEPKDVTAACFTGTAGSTASDCTQKISANVTFRTTQPLQNSEGLTVVVGFPRGIVAVLEPKEYIPFWETPLGKLLGDVLLVLGAILAFLWYIVAPGYLMYRWYAFGRDPRPPMGVTSAWFEAPKTKTARKLTAGETGTLIDEKADLRDIFATIVDLARRGYLKIIENKKNDYTLMKLTDAVTGDGLLDYEQELLQSLFKDGDLLKLKGASLVSEIEKVKDTIYKSLVQDEFFPENPQKIRDMYSIIGGIAMFTFNLPLFLICMTFGLAMPRKTLRGAQEAAVARSLKNFLASQEEKLTFQAKNYMFFEKFLPYAIAFGVEKIWAERFADIAMQQPDWYVGSTSGGSFNAPVFVNSLNSSFAGVSSAATPTRSSSGFSSGFGGGSSGGGGGGGGGGSW